MNESCEAIRLLNILDDYLSRWYQSDNTEYGTTNTSASPAWLHGAHPAARKPATKRGPPNKPTART